MALEMAHSFSRAGHARLRVVFWDRVGEALGVLQHRLNLWSSQKAQTQWLILDALRQPLDNCRRLSKGYARLCRQALCLVQPTQRRLDLPTFSWQPELCCQPCCLAQVANGWLALPLPRGQHSQRPQVDNAEAPVRSQTFPESMHCFSCLALIPCTK